MQYIEKQIMDILLSAKRQAGTAKNLARISGIPESTLSKWLNKKQSPRLSEIAPLLEYLGVQIIDSNHKYNDYVFIPKVAAQAGAGSSLVTSGEKEGLYAFRKDFIAKENISAPNSILLDVLGNSMYPLMHSGDTILVDKSKREIYDGCIYLITVGDELLVKRVHKTTKGVILRSENHDFPDINVEYPDIETFIVHGRVKWIGKLI